MRVKTVKLSWGCIVATTINPPAEQTTLFHYCLALLRLFPICDNTFLITDQIFVFASKIGPDKSSYLELQHKSCLNDLFGPK